MKTSKLLGMTLVAMCVTCFMATSSFGLPDVSLTLCAGTCAYPLHLNYSSNTVRTGLENVNGSILTGEGLHVLSLFGSLTALGVHD